MAKKRIIPVSKLRAATTRAAARMLAAKNIRMMERRYQVVKMRKEGYTTKEIADTLGINVVTVRDDIVRLLKQTITETAETTEENRQLQIERLDGLLKKYYGMAEMGSLAAAATVLAIEARRAKLLALDVPETKKLDVTGIREYVGIDPNDV